MAVNSNYLNTLLISESTLKKYTLINNNVDGMYILPAIRMSQDIDLETLISTPLVNSLKYMVNSGLLPSTEDNLYGFATQLLDDFVTPYMCWQVMLNIQTNLNYKFSNSGIVGQDDERKNRLEYNKAQLLLEQYQRYANGYASKLKDFIDRNRTQVNNIIAEVKSAVKTPNMQLDECKCGEDIPTQGIYLGDIPYNNICDYKYK